MSISQVTRTAPDGESWPADVVQAFEQEVRTASVKSHGIPPLVQSWDDGRGRVCWYNARCLPSEPALRDRCRIIFGTREREP